MHLEITAKPIDQFTGEHLYQCIILERHGVLTLCNELPISSGLPSYQKFYWRELPMFVSVRKGMKDSQPIVVRSIPSLVRLKRFDFTNGLRRDELDPPPDGSMVFLGENGELDIGDRGGVSGHIDQFRLSQQGQLPSKIIQASSEIVDDVPQPKTEVLRPRLADFQQKKTDSLLRILLDHDGIWLRTYELVEVRLEALEAFIRPIQLGQGFLHRWHDVYSDHERREPNRRTDSENTEGLRDSLSPSARTFDTVLDAVAKPKKRSTVNG